MRQRFASFFRANTMTIAIVIMVVAFGSILFLQAVATSKLQEQTKQQAQIIRQIHKVTDQIAQSSIQRTTQIDSINRHLDCIVQFFAANDRANQTIADINTCTLANTKTGSTSTIPVTGTSSATPPTNAKPTTPAPSSAVTTNNQQGSQSTDTNKNDSYPPSVIDRVVFTPLNSFLNFVFGVN